MNNFAEPQHLPMMKLSFNTLQHLILIASLLKCVSNITVDIFSSEKEPFSWIYLLKEAPRRTKNLIFLVWNMILKMWDKIFELIQIEVQFTKNYFNFFFITRRWRFWKQHRKGSIKVTPKTEKNILNISMTDHTCSACKPMQVAVFCKHILVL